MGLFILSVWIVKGLLDFQPLNYCFTSEGKTSWYHYPAPELQAVVKLQKISHGLGDGG